MLYFFYLTESDINPNDMTLGDYYRNVVLPQRNNTEYNIEMQMAGEGTPPEDSITPAPINKNMTLGEWYRNVVLPQRNRDEYNLEMQMAGEGTPPPSNPPEFANDPRHMTPEEKEDYRANQLAVQLQNQMAGDGTPPEGTSWLSKHFEQNRNKPVGEIIRQTIGDISKQPIVQNVKETAKNTAEDYKNLANKFLTKKSEPEPEVQPEKPNSLILPIAGGLGGLATLGGAAYAYNRYKKGKEKQF